jgi:GT2 family glycosyltransferase
MTSASVRSYPSASVIIPTLNRLELLRRVLDAVEGQFVPAGAELEIVVVDDGSTDGTGAWLRREAERGRLRAVVGENAGPAAARNRGAAAAVGDLLLFLGDDTVPEPGWLLAHLEQHRLTGGGDRPLAVVGYTGFSSDDDSPFRRFINEFGAQFGYLLIEDPLDVPFNFFYTSNVSIARSEIERLGGFREDFPAAAWEDIEFAYRATREGLKIHYQPVARTVHHHRIQPRTFCLRQRTSGQSAAIFASLHPELADFLGVGRVAQRPQRYRWYRPLLAAAVAIGEHIPGLVSPSIIGRYVDLSYLEGLAAGLQRS